MILRCTRFSADFQFWNICRTACTSKHSRTHALYNFFTRNKAAKTRDLLRQEGFSEETIASVHLPIGLPILAQTPAEIAISIAGEMIRCRAEAAQKR